MENKEQKYTPLGEKFDHSVFSLEPAAWTSMEALLVSQKQKRSRRRIGFFIFWTSIAAMGGGLFFSRADKTAHDVSGKTAHSESAVLEKNASTSNFNIGKLATRRLKQTVCRRIRSAACPNLRKCRPAIPCKRFFQQLGSTVLKKTPAKALLLTGLKRLSPSAASANFRQNWRRPIN